MCLSIHRVLQRFFSFTFLASGVIAWMTASKNFVASVSCQKTMAYTVLPTAAAVHHIHNWGNFAGTADSQMKPITALAIGIGASLDISAWTPFAFELIHAVVSWAWPLQSLDLILWLSRVSISCFGDRFSSGAVEIGQMDKNFSLYRLIVRSSHGLK